MFIKYQYPQTGYIKEKMDYELEKRLYAIQSKFSERVDQIEDQCDDALNSVINSVKDKTAEARKHERELLRSCVLTFRG